MTRVFLTFHPLLLLMLLLTLLLMLLSVLLRTDGFLDLLIIPCLTFSLEC